MIQSLKDKATKFLADAKDAATSVEQAVDFTAILSFVSSIITAIRGCTSQTTAQERIKEGGPVAMGAALSVVRESHPELKRLARRQKAAELVDQGTKLSDDEMKDLMSQASDIPVASAPTGVWPMILAFTALLLFSASAQAQEGVWPIDEVQNQRLDKLEGEAAKIQSSFQALNSKIDTLIQKSTASPAPAVAASTETELDEIAVQRIMESFDARLDKLEQPKTGLPSTAKEFPAAPAEKTGWEKMTAGQQKAFKAELKSIREALTEINAGSPQKQQVAAGRNLQPLYNHSPAFMGDSAGNLLNTTDQHLLDHGFTRQEISGLTAQQKNSLHGAAHAGHVPQPGRVLAAGNTVTVSRAVTYQAASGECNGRRCNRARRRG